MDFTVRLKLNEWRVISDFILEREISIQKKHLSKDLKYIPSVCSFNVFDDDDIIQEIKDFKGVIEVAVYHGENLFYYGFVENKKTLELNPDYKKWKLKAKDFIQSLEVPSSDFKFHNKSLSYIATEICDFVGVQSFFPMSMRQKVIKDIFIPTPKKEKDNSVLKILDNLFYEYGYVLHDFYVGTNPVVSASPYWDRGDIPGVTITDLDITGKINYKNQENKEVKTLKANYRKVGYVENLVLNLMGNENTRNIVKLEAGKFFPPNGDSIPQYQEYNVFPEINNEAENKVKYFNSQNKLTFGTINKNTEILWAENQKLGTYVPGYDGDGRDLTQGVPKSPDEINFGTYLHIEEHFPKKSRVVYGNKANLTIPPFLRIIGDSEESRQRIEVSKDFNPNNPTLHTSADGTVYLNTGIPGGNAYQVPNGFRPDSTVWRDVVNGDTKFYIWIPSRRFVEERREIGYCCTTTLFGPYIYGDAYVSVGQGTVYSGVFERSREYTIRSISVGDTVTSNGLIKKIVGYQFYDTPKVFDILDGWYMITRNNTKVKVLNYIGDTQGQIDRWGNIIGASAGGIVEFEYFEGVYDYNFKEIVNPINNFFIDAEGKPLRIAQPFPIYDIDGTKAIFIPPTEKIEEEEVETSFLYDKENTSNFLQGLINERLIEKIDLSYDGFLDESSGSKKHPDIGSFINVNMPDSFINNERFIVNEYTINLDTLNNPTVKIKLKKTKRWEPGKTYPDLISWFPNIPASQFNPEPVVETIYTNTRTNGIHPKQFPRNPILGRPGVHRNLAWHSRPSFFWDQQGEN